MSKGFFAFASAAAVLAGAYLCVHDKDGWGWFLFIAVLIAGAAA